MAADDEKIKILIVDDSISARIMMIDAFPEFIKKHSVFIEAVDGLDGIEKYNSSNPDIVFLDLTMPRMNGKDALVEIKKIKPDAIVIMATADRQKETKNELLKAGAIRVIHKPVDTDEIRDVMTKYAFGGE